MEYKIMCFIIMSLSFGEIYCQLPDCTEYVTYRKDGERNQAIITHAAPSRGITNLTVFFAIPGQYFPMDYGTLKLRKDILEVVQDLLNGKDLEYILDFPASKERPIIYKIELNNNVLCRGPNLSNVYKTYLNHAFIYPQNSKKLSQIPNPRPKGSKTSPIPVIPNTKPTNRPTTYKPPNSRSNLNKWIESLPYSDICGRRIEQKGNTPLVIGGEQASPGEFPWLAAIFHPERRRKTYICAGSLISDQYVVTAAHCLATEQLVYVELGRYNIANDFENSVGTYATRDNFIIHEGYRVKEANNDIALIIVNRVQFTSKIRPVCLWNYGTIFDHLDKKGTVAGWGRIENDGDIADILQKVQIKRVDLDKCRKSNSVLSELATNNTFCAGGELKGPCHGDSGGGFFKQNSGIWYLRGIVSNSLGNTRVCNLAAYGVYVDIIYYLDWMKPHLLLPTRVDYFNNS